MPQRRTNIYEKQTINHSRLLQIIQDEYRLNPEEKKMFMTKYCHQIIVMKG